MLLNSLAHLNSYDQSSVAFPAFNLKLALPLILSPTTTYPRILAPAILTATGSLVSHSPSCAELCPPKQRLNRSITRAGRSKVDIIITNLGLHDSVNYVDVISVLTKRYCYH